MLVECVRYHARRAYCCRNVQGLARLRSAQRPVNASERWRGWATVRPGRLMYGGQMAPGSLHAHHAVQVLFTAGTDLVLRDAAGAELACSAAVIPPNVAHAIVRGSPACLLVLLDPESRVAWSFDAGGDSVGSWVRDWTAVPRQWENPSAVEELLAASATVDRPVVPNHPALRQALELIPDLLPGGVPLSTLARAVHLSESRLRHLFSEELGLPFRPYVLWIRLHRAVALIASGLPLTAVAHQSGFADAAHMTRTFHRMFGDTPSALSRDVVWMD